MTLPGRKYSNGGSSYRYGFNGKELDTDGDIVQYDYGFRIYDPRLVRFKSVDPLFKGFPWNSPYSYAEGDLIRCIDLDGLEKVTIHQRCFAPWDLFGDILPGQKPYKGDNRSFSMFYGSGKSTQTSRIVAITSFDIDKGEQIGKTNAYCDPSVGPRNFYGSNGSTRETPDEETHVYHSYKPSGFFSQQRVQGKESISINFSGHDARIEDYLAPDIDWTGSYSFDNTDKGILKVDFQLYGKQFPAYETFIEDGVGKRISILTRSAPEKSKIFRLFGDASFDLESMNFRIHLDDKKNFNGTIEVREKAKGGIKGFFGMSQWNTYTIDDWNKKQTDKKAAPDVKSP